MTHNEENKILLNSFLTRTFFKDWSTSDDIDRLKLYNNIELQLVSDCNLKCSYCYYNDKNGFGLELNNPHTVGKWENVLKNIDILLNFLEEKKFFPGKFDVFSGDPLIYKNSYIVFRKIIDFYVRNGERGRITVPSNMTFLKSESLTKEVENLIKYAEENGIGFGISASIDGKYQDYINRPVAGNVDQHKFYSDEFYDIIFSFAKKYNIAFHPMIHHKNIENWSKNWKWFQSMFERFELGWNPIYLLEVRNTGWNKESLKFYEDLYKEVLNFVYEKIGPERFLYGFLFNGIEGCENISNMNMFNNVGRMGRGVGCSLQTHLQVRMGDLSVNSCHRLSYDALNAFKFVVDENDKIVDIDPLNVEFYLATMSTDRRNWPYCESCLIKEICTSGCLGSQFEITGDAFTPIHSVCALEHAKVKAQIEFLKEKKIFNNFLNYLDSSQQTSYKIFDKYIK